MAPVPDSVLLCLAVSYSEFRSSEWWQIMLGWGGGGGHTLIVMVGEYCRGTEKRIKTSLPWSNTQFTLHRAAAVSDVNPLWLRLHCAVNSAPPLAPSKYYSPRQFRGVRAEERNRKEEKRLTFSLWKEWRKFPLSSPSSLGVPGGLLMPLKLFGEFWKQSGRNIWANVFSFSHKNLFFFPD